METVLLSNELLQNCWGVVVASAHYGSQCSWLARLANSVFRAACGILPGDIADQSLAGPDKKDTVPSDGSATDVTYPKASGEEVKPPFIASERRYDLHRQFLR